MNIGELFSVSMLASGVQLASPYLYAALGETYGQRSGVLNLGVDGVMLMGAFASFWTVYEIAGRSYGAGALVAGVLVALLVGLLMGLITAFVNVTLQAEQGISGIGIYLFGLGMSGLLFQRSFPDEIPLVRGFPKIDIPLLNDIPYIGDIFFAQNILVYGAFALVPITWFVLNKTTLGLKIRAVGQNPEAADAMGISVTRIRYFTVTLGSMLGAVAGASLSIGMVNAFQENMTAGMGFIAVALVYFGSWRPGGVLVGALLFSVVTAWKLRVQTIGIDLPVEYVSMAPYVLTIIALIFASRRIDQPAALTKPFQRGE
jgi:simple sugar transport system permease protein